MGSLVTKRVNEKKISTIIAKQFNVGRQIALQSVTVAPHNAIPSSIQTAHHGLVPHLGWIPDPSRIQSLYFPRQEWELGVLVTPSRAMCLRLSGYFCPVPL